MAGDFTKQAETALKLISKNGQTVTFTRDTTSFDPVKGGAGSPATLGISGVTTAGVNGTLVATDDYNSHKCWTSNGLPFIQNMGFNLFTGMVNLGGVWVLVRANETGTLLYDSRVTSGLASPVGLAFEAPSVGTGLPQVTDPAFTAWSGQAVRLSNYKGTVFDAFDNAFKIALVVGKAAILLLAAKGLAHEPKPGDSVTLVDGSIWVVKGQTVLNPAGLPILYTMGVVLK